MTLFNLYNFVELRTRKLTEFIEMENNKHIQDIIEIIKKNDLTDKNHIINLIGMTNEAIITLSYYEDNTHIINALAQINKILIEIAEA